MYDRKTWLVVGVCAVLLALNLYYTNKNRQEIAKKQPPPEQVDPKDAAEQPGDDDKPEKTGDLAEPPPPPAEEELTILETPGAIFTLSNIGGGVKLAEIKEQLQVADKDAQVLINLFGTHSVGALSDGVDRFDGLAFSLDPAASVDGKKAVYRATTRDQLEVTKSFTVVEGGEPGADYLLDFEITLKNVSPAAVSLDRWSLSLGSIAPLYQREWEQQTGFFYRQDDSFDFTAGTKFKGGWFSKAQSSIENETESLEYAGVSNQFFATVLKPVEPYNSGVWAKARSIKLPDSGEKSRNAVRAGVRLPASTLNPGGETTLKYRLFMGPKQNRMLRMMGDGYGDVMNYGMFSWFSRILSFTLYWIHEWIGGISGKWSWGFAIIILTLVVRGAMWPLQNKSTRTMKRMSKLQPEMKKLKEKYADDPNRQNQEMMKLYRKYHINPMGGCLPLFVQLPIFFGFYRMLQYAVELRDQGFMWVPDLSQPDRVASIAGLPINLLPILMGLSSFAQIAMTPKTGDKMQQRIMLLMPLMFLVFCYNFASALALYWTVSNLFAIGQTWLMSKMPEVELKERKVANKKGWMQRLAEKQEEMQRMQRDRASGKPPGSSSDKPKKKRPPRTGG